MAKSNSNSNDLRQDQPECSHTEVWGLAEIAYSRCMVFDEIRSDIAEPTKAHIRFSLDGGPQGLNPHTWVDAPS